jgi:hypothetical protein
VPSSGKKNYIMHLFSFMIIDFYYAICLWNLRSASCNLLGQKIAILTPLYLLVHARINNTENRFLV